MRRVRHQGWPVPDATAAAGIATRTAHRRLARCRVDGAAALHDHKPTPAGSPRRLPRPTVDDVLQLRRQRLPGPPIASALGQPRATVGHVLRRHGLGRPQALDSRPPVVRYHREWPGELLHLAIKKLGKIARPSHRVTGNRRDGVDSVGREQLRVAIDRVMTVNGSPYRRRLFRQALSGRGIAHERTRPSTPRTNGKTERFIQTSLRERAYASPDRTSAERTHAMAPWISRYNHARPHSALAGRPPIAELTDVSSFDS